MSVKAQVNAALDPLEMGFVKASIDTYRSKTLLKKKALCGGSIGPLTVTNAHYDRNVRTQEEVRKALANVPGITVTPRECYIGDSRMVNLYVEVPLTSKKVRIIQFRWELFKSYISRDLDPSYRTYWYVMDVQDMPK